MKNLNTYKEFNAGPTNETGPAGDKGETGINEGKFSISTKSNVPSTWTNASEVEEDLIKFIDGVGDSNGYEGVRDLILSLEGSIRHARKIQKKLK